MKIENSYLKDKDIEKINKVPPRPMPPILQIIDSDQYVSFDTAATMPPILQIIDYQYVSFDTAATAATTVPAVPAVTAVTAAVPPYRPPYRPPPYVAIDMPDGCIKEPGCIKETRKACAIWLTYCVCVNQLFLLKIMVFCATLALSITEVYFAYKFQEDKTMLLVSIDGELLLVMLGLFFFMEYVLFNVTFREAMLNHNRNLDRCNLITKIKYKAYFCILVLKTIVTSVALSFLVKKANCSGLLTATVGVILGGQCVMIMWCLKKNLQF
jgi:hypothetical protein